MALKAQKAKEAIILETRINLCNHAARLAGSAIITLPRRDMMLHVRAIAESGNDVPWTIQLKLCERQAMDSLQDLLNTNMAGADEEADGAQAAIKVFVPMFSSWDIVAVDKFSAAHPSYGSVFAHTMDRQQALQMTDQTEEDLVALKQSEWEAAPNIWLSLVRSCLIASSL